MQAIKARQTLRVLSNQREVAGAPLLRRTCFVVTERGCEVLLLERKKRP
jgi:hypothetical protein